MEPREGFYIYNEWELAHPGGYTSATTRYVFANQKLKNFISRELGKDYYVGTSVTHYVPLKDSRVRFYDSKTGGNEIPRDYKLTDSITIYVEFID